MNSISFRLSVLVLAIFCVSLFSEVIVYYEAVNTEGNSWLYNYTIVNNDGFDIKSVSIEFDLAQFSNLAITSSQQIQNGWDEDFLDISPGFKIYDSLATGANLIASGQSLSGFSVSFDFSGVGTPANQYFEIYDPDDYSEPLITGTTIPIPEPASLLFMVGVWGLIKNRRL